MESPGTILRQAREQRGLTLTEIANITRISRTTLSHLEEDNFEELPAQVFVRGFLRNVARELKIDPEMVVGVYEKHTGNIHQPALDHLKHADAQRPTAAPRQQLVTSGRSRRRRFPNWDRVTEVVGSAKPAYVIGSLVVMLGLALMASVVTTSGLSFSDEAPRKATWNVKADGPKARWILDGQSNLAGTAKLPSVKSDDAPSETEVDERRAPGEEE